jgi:hypothetical protein
VELETSPRSRPRLLAHRHRMTAIQAMTTRKLGGPADNHTPLLYVNSSFFITSFGCFSYSFIFLVGFLVGGASVLATHWVVDDDVTSTIGRRTSGQPSIVEEVDVAFVVKLFWLWSGAQHTLKTIFMLFVEQRPPIRRCRSSFDDVAETATLLLQP